MFDSIKVLRLSSTTFDLYVCFFFSHWIKIKQLTSIYRSLSFFQWVHSFAIFKNFLKKKNERRRIYVLLFRAVIFIYLFYLNMLKSLRFTFMEHQICGFFWIRLALVSKRLFLSMEKVDRKRIKIDFLFYFVLFSSYLFEEKNIEVYLVFISRMCCLVIYISILFSYIIMIY